MNTTPMETATSQHGFKSSMIKLVKSIYRPIISWRGKWRLDRLIVQGFPKSLRAPVLFLFDEKLSAEDQEKLDKIEKIRAQIASRGNETVPVYQSPDTDLAGGVAPGQTKDRTFERIAYITSIQPKWGSFLYLCALHSQAKTILELGGCAGISGSYMASSQWCERFITIEGSSELAELAESSLSQVADNASVINQLFDDALDQLLPTLESGLDMVHIDGQHEKVATLHYFERVIPYLNSGAIVVFDDIRWSQGMWDAWQEIRQRKGLVCSITLQRSGLCVWEGGQREGKVFEI
jgi:predicted O-methyltransferase YrrM